MHLLLILSMPTLGLDDSSNTTRHWDMETLQKWLWNTIPNLQQCIRQCFLNYVWTFRYIAMLINIEYLRWSWRFMHAQTCSIGFRPVDSVDCAGGLRVYKPCLPTRGYHHILPDTIVRRRIVTYTALPILPIVWQRTHHMGRLPVQVYGYAWSVCGLSWLSTQDAVGVSDCEYPKC